MSKYNILVTDDSTLNRKLMTEVLKNSKYNLDFEFYEAKDGVEAIDMVKRHKIDLILLDLMMPNKDGYEVLEDLREMEDLKDIPVIVNSAVTDMESIKNTLEMGAMDYFIKPLTEEQMEVVIPLKVKNALEFNDQKSKLKEINKQMVQDIKIAEQLKRIIADDEKAIRNVDIYKEYYSDNNVFGHTFSVMENSGETWVLMCDIKANGIGATVVSTILKAIFSNLIVFLDRPKDIIDDINKSFSKLLSDDINIHFSCFVGVLREGKLVYTNAGLISPILVNESTKEMFKIENKSYSIGVFDDVEYEDYEVDFSENMGVFFYTDSLYKKVDGKIASAHDGDVLNYMLENKEELFKDYGKSLNDFIQKYRRDFENVLGDVLLVYLKRK